MSPTAVYTHFRTKEQLLFQIALAGHQDVDRVTESAVVGIDDIRERLRRLVDAFVLWHADSHVSARVIQYEMGALTPQHHAHIGLLRREITGRFRAVLDEGLHAGVFRIEQPDLTVMTLLSMGIDVARWYQPHGRWSAQDIARHYSDLALRMVAAVE